jgi:dTDP-4-dehydrorhamnose reductase
MSSDRQFHPPRATGHQPRPSARVLVVGRRGRVAAALGRAVRPASWSLARVGRDGVDLTDAGSVDRLIERFRPDVVVNVAGFADVDGAERAPEAARALNAEGPRHLAAAVARLGASLVHLSTDYVFDGRLGRPYRPDDPTCPLSVYGRTKADGEEAVRAACPRHAIVRGAWLFDAASRNFVTAVLARAAGQSRIPVVADQTGSPTATDDLAASLVALVACLLAGRDEAIGTHHAVGAGHATRHALAAAVLDAAAARGLPTARAVPVPTRREPGAAPRPGWSVLDPTGLARLTGRPPRPWRDAVADVVAAIAAAGPVPADRPSVPDVQRRFLSFQPASEGFSR